MIADNAGNLYGTTLVGGDNNYGTLFELRGLNHQSLITLAMFDKANGAYPTSRLIADGTGNLYGTTEGGGPNNAGTVFELRDTGFVIPEPTSLTLLALGVMGLLTRRGNTQR